MLELVADAQDVVLAGLHVRVPVARKVLVHVSGIERLVVQSGVDRKDDNRQPVVTERVLDGFDEAVVSSYVAMSLLMSDSCNTPKRPSASSCVSPTGFRAASVSSPTTRMSFRCLALREGGWWVAESRCRGARRRAALSASVKERYDHSAVPPGGGAMRAAWNARARDAHESSDNDRTDAPAASIRLSRPLPSHRPPTGARASSRRGSRVKVIRRSGTFARRRQVRVVRRGRRHAARGGGMRREDEARASGVVSLNNSQLQKSHRRARRSRGDRHDDAAAVGRLAHGPCGRRLRSKAPRFVADAMLATVTWNCDAA